MSNRTLESWMNEFGKSGMSSTGDPELDRVIRELARTIINIENLHQELEAASVGGISDPGHYEDVKAVLENAYEYYNYLVGQWNQLQQQQLAASDWAQAEAELDRRDAALAARCACFALGLERASCLMAGRPLCDPRPRRRRPPRRSSFRW